MDSRCLDALFCCLLVGIIFQNGCHATHGRRNSLHMDHTWKAVNISIESPALSFIVRPSDSYTSPTNMLLKPLFVGYPDLEPSVLSASYGPFQTRQSLLISEEEANSGFFVQGHIIDREIHRHTPIIRVLFHLERHRSDAPDRPRAKTCLKAEVEYMGLTSTGYCSPKGLPSSCLAEIEVLLAWKANISASLNVTYAILPQSEFDRCSSRFDDPFRERDGIAGEFLGRVRLLVDDDRDYTLVTEDRLVHMEVPRRVMGLNERFEIPIMVHRQFLCTLRAKMKEGIKLTRIKYMDPTVADQMSMVRSKGSLGMATAEKQQGPFIPGSEEMPIAMSMEFEIRNQTGPQRQISWRVDCANGQDKFGSRFVTEVTGSQEWLKEFFPVIKSNDLVNTAVLGSGKVHYPLRVLAVSHASDVFTITDRVRCLYANSDVVKVEPDCSGVFLNGSESEGAEQVSINITFQESTMSLPLRVWMPELPLTVSLSDDRLSVVKKWKVARKDATDSGVDENDGENGKENDHVTCHLTYQTALVDVLTRFYVPVEDEAGGRRYFSGPDAQQLITDIVVRHLKVSDHRLATHDGRRVTGLEPGVTAVQVVHPHTKEVLGSKKLHILTDKVEVVDVKVAMVTGMSLTFGSIDTVNNVFGFNLMAMEGFIAQHQEAFLYTTITFDDRTTVALQDLDPSTYSLVVTSSQNSVIAISPDTAPDLPSVITTGQGSSNVMVGFLPAQECQRKRKENCIASSSFRVGVTYNSSHPLLNEIVSGSDGEPWMRFSPGVRFVDPGVVRTNISPYYVEQLPPAEINDCVPQISSIPIDGPFPPTIKRNYTVMEEPEQNTDDETSLPPEHGLSVMEIVLYIFLAIFGFAVLLFIINFLVMAGRYFRKKKPAMSDGIHPQSWIMLGVNWDKRGQGDFPLPSDESFHLRGESTEGSGREDMSSTMSAASVPRTALSENEEPQEGDPLLQRLNNGAVVRGNNGCGRTNGHIPNQHNRERIEATNDVRWPREVHEMERLGNSSNSLEVVHEGQGDQLQCKEGDRENVDIRSQEESSDRSPREEARVRPTRDDFVLRQLQAMKETAT